MKDEKLYWNELLANSQDYIDLLKLTQDDIEKLGNIEFKKSPKTSMRGFMSICVDGQMFAFIPAYDFAINHGMEDDFKYRYLVMAVAVNNPSLNNSNGIEDPWLGDNEQCTPDEEDMYPQCWTNIVPSEWHQKIVVELSKES